ncbi:hypothetical protein CDD83_5605 [Cordyceps sp. RAO-2017]|nr:hypothetical protein CDD83_5605 [Cordyceps sp. RAO-2017]
MELLRRDRISPSPEPEKPPPYPLLAAMLLPSSYIIVDCKGLYSAEAWSAGLTWRRAMKTADAPATPVKMADEEPEWEGRGWLGSHDKAAYNGARRSRTRQDDIQSAGMMDAGRGCHAQPPGLLVGEQSSRHQASHAKGLPPRPLPSSKNTKCLAAANSGRREEQGRPPPYLSGIFLLAAGRRQRKSGSPDGPCEMLLLATLALCLGRPFQR